MDVGKIVIVFDSGVLATARRVQVALRAYLASTYNTDVDFVSLVDAKFTASLIGFHVQRVYGEVLIVEVL